jgi:hypothetical protein
MFKQLLFAALFTVSLSAHGGQYRGPGDVVPPGAGGGRTGRPSGPTTGGPAGPSAPRPSGPATGGPAGPTTGGPPGGPTGPGGPRTGGRGTRIGIDLSQWQFWWEFNKDPFIKLRDAINQGAPETGSDEFYLGSTRAKVTATHAPTKEDRINVLATLRRAMESTNNVDITTACMIAMAKIGMDHPEFKLKDIFTPHLKSKNQEVRETAALALGIAAQTESDELDILIKLALDK